GVKGGRKGGGGRRRVAMARPGGTEIATARPNPMATRRTVAVRSVSNSPERNMSTPADQAAPGEGRNVRLIQPLAYSANHSVSGLVNDSARTVQRAQGGRSRPMAKIRGARALARRR